MKSPNNRLLPYCSPAAGSQTERRGVLPARKKISRIDIRKVES